MSTDKENKTPGYPKVDGFGDPCGALNECMAALKSLYGDNPPHPGNTLWSYVMSAYGQLLSRLPSSKEQHAAVRKYVLGVYALRFPGCKTNPDDIEDAEEKAFYEKKLDLEVKKMLRDLLKPWRVKVERPMGMPPSPESLMGALHHKVHVEGTKSRGVKAAKVNTLDTSSISETVEKIRGALKERREKKDGT
jgi:hypothetical protein